MCILCGKILCDEGMPDHMVMDHDQDRRMSRISIPWQEFDCQLKSIKADAKTKFTLAFTNHTSLPYSSILAHFSQFIYVVPSILKGPLKGMVLISFESKKKHMLP